MRKIASFLLIAGISLPVASGILACHSGDGENTNHASDTPTAQVATAQRGAISHTLRLAGQFQPFQVVDVHPKVTGYMTKINVDIGDRVHKGQTLAVLEIPELTAQLQGTVYDVQRTKDDIVRAKHEISRDEATHAALHADYQRLLETSKAQPGLIAQQELDDAQGRDLSSAAQVDAAKSAEASAEQHAQMANSDNKRIQAMQNYTDVVSPFDGVVVWRYADTGALIQSGDNSNDSNLPIVKLSQSGLLRLRMPVPENDVKYVHIGDPMQVRVDAIGRTFTGKVVRFTREVDFETRTMETEVDVENKDLSITPGMYADTQMQLATAKNVVTIPVDSIVLSGDQDTVYMLGADNHVHIRPVTVGIRGSKLAEIESGVQPGDRVILGGQEKYHDDQEIKPLLVNEPASENVNELGGVIDVKAEEQQSNGGPQ
ncbi:MAG: efflux RND transporter periplasmic adaptor subunit [Acidobacteria bacterium]|nr:efflux RND transporter periplasmic adaptor subunit [Acidobacteriota bacterium]